MPSKNPAVMISSDLKRSAESLEILERRGSDIRFRIRAKHLRETRMNISILEGIEASDLNSDGSIHYSIHSDFAKYDQARRMVEFSGNVRMFLGKELEFRTGSLQYDLNSEIGSASESVRWVSPEATGSAQGFHYYRKKDLFELASNVNFLLKKKKMPFDASKEPVEIRASSESAACFIKQNRMVFTGKVKVESDGSGTITAEKVELDWNPEQKNIRSLIASGSAVCQFKEETETRVLSGEIVAFYIGSAKSLERIRIIGQAMMNQKAQVQEHNLSAAQIELVVDSVHNAVAAIHATGEVNGQSIANFRTVQGIQETLISGAALDAQFEPETKQLKKVEAQGRAKLSSTAGKEMASNDLRAEEIRAYFRNMHSQASIDYLQAEGGIHWVFIPQRKNVPERPEPVRTLTAEKMEVRYSNLGNYPDSGTASGKKGNLVVIAEDFRHPSNRLQIRRLSADLIKFHFYPEKYLLKDITAEGHVQTEYDGIEKSAPGGSMHSSSEQLRAEFGFKDGAGYLKSAAQWGDFRYWDDSYSATAGRCDYNAEDQFLILKEEPKLTDKRSSTAGDLMKYDLKAKMLQIRGNVKSLLSSQKNETIFFQSSGSSSPAVIFADELGYWREEGRFRYANAIVLSESQQLQAGILEIFDNGEKVEAQGKVHHLLFPKENLGSLTKLSQKKRTVSPVGLASENIRRSLATKASPQQGSVLASNSFTLIQSDRLRYLFKGGTINYHGHVNLLSKDLNLSADDLNGLLGPDGKSIKHVQADGDVVLQHQSRICRGESAEWFPDSLNYIVTGNPAEIDDPEYGHSRPHRLTYFQADDRIVLEK
jgi:lipopolysaccharide export system protein LptA